MRRSISEVGAAFPSGVFVSVRESVTAFDSSDVTTAVQLITSVRAPVLLSTSLRADSRNAVLSVVRAQHFSCVEELFQL